MFMLLLLKLSQGVQVMYLDIYVQQSRLNLDNKSKMRETFLAPFEFHTLVSIWIIFSNSYVINIFQLFS